MIELKIIIFNKSYFQKRRFARMLELTNKRTELVLEILKKEEELENLNTEFNIMQSDEYKVAIIEEMLDKKIKAIREVYYIDRSQEAEISNTLASKASQVKSAVSNADYKIKEAERRCKEYTSTYRGYIRSEEWSSYSYYLSWQSESEWKREKRKKIKGYETQIKQEEKICADYCKESEKECVNELKRILGELEIDTKRFYKNGISKENLLKCISLMTEIYYEATEYGNVPLSFQQRIYKWQQIEKEIPNDLEKEIQENDSTERKKLQKSLSTAEAILKKAKQELKGFQDEKERAEKEIEKLNEHLEQCENNLPELEKVISEKQEKALKVAEENHSCKMTQLEEELAFQKELIEKAVVKLNHEIQKIQEQISTTTKERNETQEQLEKAFILSFGKKKEFRGKIELLNNFITDLNKELEQFNEKLRNQQSKNPEKKFNEKSDAEKSTFAQVMNEINEEANNAKERLRLDISNTKKNIAKQTKLVSRKDTQISESQQDIESLKQEVLDIEAKVKSFHFDYLIKTYSKEAGISSLISEKIKVISSLSSEIKAQKKELKMLDKEIADAEKEQKKIAEKERIAKIEKAKEEERQKKEQLEREERIKK